MAAVLIAGTVVLSTRSPATVVIQGADRFPSQTLSDVVSYADAVVVATVDAERKLPVDPDPDISGGYIGREVVLDVQEVVWAREGAPEPPGTVAFVDSGWMQQGRAEVPVAIEGATRLEVDEVYLLPLARGADGAWFATTTRVTVEVDSGRTRRGDGDTQANAELAGRTLPEVRGQLSRARPEPTAAKYAHLPADERIEAVRAERDNG